MPQKGQKNKLGATEEQRQLITEFKKKTQSQFFGHKLRKIKLEDVGTPTVISSQGPRDMRSCNAGQGASANSQVRCGMHIRNPMRI